MTLMRQDRAESQAPPAFDRDGSYSDTDWIDDPYLRDDEGEEITYEDLLLTYPRQDHKWGSHLDPNPQASNNTLSHLFERLEPKRRATLKNGTLTPADIASFRSGGTASAGRYFPLARETTRSLCEGCREQPFYARPRVCHVCVINTRFLCKGCSKIVIRSHRPSNCEACRALRVEMDNPLRPRRLTWEEYLTKIGDDLLRKAAATEYAAAGGSPNVCTLDEFIENNNLLYRTRSDSPPLAYSHVDATGRYIPSTYTP